MPSIFKLRHYPLVRRLYLLGALMVLAVSLVPA